MFASAAIIDKKRTGLQIVLFNNIKKTCKCLMLQQNRQRTGFQIVLYNNIKTTCKCLLLQQEGFQTVLYKMELVID